MFLLYFITIIILSLNDRIRRMRAKRTSTLNILKNDDISFQIPRIYSWESIISITIYFHELTRIFKFKKQRHGSVWKFSRRNRLHDQVVLTQSHHWGERRLKTARREDPKRIGLAHDGGRKLTRGALLNEEKSRATHSQCLSSEKSYSGPQIKVILYSGAQTENGQIFWWICLHSSQRILLTRSYGYRSLFRVSRDPALNCPCSHLPCKPPLF